MRRWLEMAGWGCVVVGVLLTFLALWYDSNNLVASLVAVSIGLPIAYVAMPFWMLWQYGSWLLVLSNLVVPGICFVWARSLAQAGGEAS